MTYQTKDKGIFVNFLSGVNLLRSKRTRKTERMARTRTLLPILDQRIIGVLEWIPRVDWCGFHSCERPLAPALKVRLPTPWFTGAKTVRYSAEISYQGIPDHPAKFDVTRRYSRFVMIGLGSDKLIGLYFCDRDTRHEDTPLPLPSSFPLSLSPSLISL